MEPPKWTELLSALSAAIDATPNKRDADYVPVVNKLDAVLDEVKSGEDVSPVLEKLVNLLRRLFVYPNWQMIQTASVQPLLISVNPPETMPLLSLLFGHLAFPKREVKEATGQAFGALASSFGDAVFSLGQPSLLSRLVTATSNPATEWETLEGYMMAVGYLLSRCASASAANVKQLLDIVFALSEHKLFPSYSNYVRLAALKALSLIMRSPHAPAQLANGGQELEQKLQAVVFARLDDENIDVRKAAGRVVETWTTYKKNATSAIFSEILTTLEGAKRWEHRHGLAFALSRLATPASGLVAQLEWSLVATVLAALPTQIQHQHADGKEAANVKCASNAAATLALTNVFLCLQRQAAPKDGQPALKEVFEKNVQQQILWLLGVSEPTLIDAGGVALQQLIAANTDFMRPYLGSFLCLVFKNKFHASLPIRDSSIRNWRVSVGDREVEFLAAIAEDLIAVLLQDAESKNPEVRETVFKAFEEMFTRIGSQPSMATEPRGLQLLQVLLKGSDNATGNNSEYPRVAAVNALSRYLSASAPHLTSSTAFVGALQSALLPAFPIMLADEFDNFIIAVLNCMTSIVRNWHEKVSTSYFYPSAGPLLALSHSPIEVVQFAAVPTLTAVLGNLGTAVYLHPVLLLALVAGLKGKFGVTEEGTEEEERQRNSRVLRYIGVDIGSQVLGSSALKDALPILLQLGAEALVLEENREDIGIQANGFILLVSLLNNANARALVAASGRMLRLLRVVLRYCIAVSTGAAADFEFEASHLSSQKEVKVEAALEEEDEDDDEEPLKVKAVKGANAEVWIATRTLVIGRLFTFVLPLLKSKSLAAKYHQLVAAYGKMPSIAGVANLLAVDVPSLPRSGVARTFTEEQLAAAHATLSEVLHHRHWDAAAPLDKREELLDLAVSALTPARISATPAAKLHDDYVHLWKLCRATGEVTARERRLKGHLVELLATFWRAAHASPLDHFLKISTLLRAEPDTEEVDDEVQQRLVLTAVDGRGVDLAEFNPQYVSKRVTAALADVWNASEAAKTSILSYVSGKTHNFTDLSDEMSFRWVSALNSLAPQFRPAQQVPTLEALVPALIATKDGDESEQLTYVFNFATNLLKVEVPLDSLEMREYNKWITALIALSHQKWFISLQDGRVLVEAVLLAGHLLLKLNERTNPLSPKYYQLMADVLANEDISEAKSAIFPALQEMALAHHAPLILPPPTPPSEHKNETFSKFAQS